MLTERILRNLKPKEKRYMICDADHLYIEVLPSGVLSWIYRQQSPSIKRVIGRYPDMDLYSARVERDKIRITVRESTATSSTPIFRVLAEEWLHVRCEPNTTPKHTAKQKSRLARLVYPKIGDMPVDKITAPDVLAILRDIEADGYIDLTHDVKQLIGMIMRYGVATGQADRDVTADLRGAIKPISRAHRATLTRAEDVGALMRAVDSLPNTLVKWALLLNLYTFCRPGEVRRAEWKEFDIAKKLWKIPAEKMKRRRPHLVPLSTQALTVLHMADCFHTKSKYVFPSARTTLRPMSDAAELAAIRRLGYEKSELSIHGFRSIASTILNENGWPVDAIERQLSHVEDNAVRAAYNYAQFMDIRTPMMQWYANYLDALRDGTPLPKKHAK